MSNAGVALTRAVVAALSTDAGLSARMGGVYDAPPPGAVVPYLTVGPDEATDASSFVREARDHRVRVRVWEAPLKALRCAQTLAAVETVVAGMGALLDGHRLISMRFVRSGVEAEIAGGPTRGSVEFRARTVAVDGGANV